SSRPMAALGFIPASEQDAFRFRSEQISSEKSPKLSGEEVRRFYEDLVKEKKTREDQSSGATNKRDPHGGFYRRPRRRVRRHHAEAAVRRETRDEREGNQRREASSSERGQELRGLRLLRCAHQGDIPGLKELISKGDSYLWTAVMCASWSGQPAAVRLLLSRGAAWVGVVDTRGRDAQDLAVEGISMCPRTNSKCLQLRKTSPAAFRSSHLSSTLHQFSVSHPQPSPYYCLPPSSNSYKMMVRSGWTPGTGLGPEADGPKQPVPTVLKRDLKGLGFGLMKRAKVTHFQAGDRDAVKHQRQDKEKGPKGQKKDEIRRKEQEDKSWERDFRASFY
uniref:G-patch domain and ankyrin repeats 1 n=1 Tax=Fundulus heteroclitus TaxID=8078 RepID=A0A3Q2UEV8_FUNHE